MSKKIIKFKKDVKISKKSLFISKNKFTIYFKKINSLFLVILLVLLRNC